MPVWTVRLVRASLVYLGVGVLLGAILLLQKAGFLPTGDIPLVPLHMEVVLVGWFVQLTMGIAYWILPRYPVAPERGPACPLPWGFWLLNLGILAVSTRSVLPSLPGLVLAGRWAEAVAVLLFGLTLGPRIRQFLAPRGS